MSGFHEFSAKNIDGQEIPMAEFRGRVALIVNVASHCGFTSQYKGLEDLYRKYKDKGLVILGFPCNQFGKQEPGDEVEIKNFCSLTYEVSFPMFAKIEVNGDSTHPLYAFLKKEAKGLMNTEAIKWNFTKFLVDKEGRVLDRFAPATTPQELEDDVRKALSLT